MSLLCSLKIQVCIPHSASGTSKTAVLNVLKVKMKFVFTIDSSLFVDSTGNLYIL